MNVIEFGGFGNNTLAEPSKEFLGGKGFHLYEMSERGFRVPRGVIIPVSEYEAGRKITNKEYTNLHTKLQPGKQLFSVRSGAPVSMPGMMDTILNVGINDQSLGSYKEIYGERFALDCYRRLIRMMGETCFEIPKEKFDKVYNQIKNFKYGSKDAPNSELDFNITHFENLVFRYLELVKAERGIDVGALSFPDQLRICINAVWRSWMSERAIAYRKNNNISDEIGTAVVVQKMVFGNRNENSCTGVLFTRNPNTGENAVYGEFLVNAQGEDVVAGTATPRPIQEMQEWNPDVYMELVTAAEKLADQYKDMQDIEFTVEDGEMYILQTRTGKRSAKAAFRIVYDLFKEGVIGMDDVEKRITREDLAGLKKPMIDPNFKKLPLAIGIPASGSIVSGKAVFSSESAINCKEPCILIKEETLPEDYSGMVAAAGVLTLKGGTTSHAAVVARSINKTCVVGCAELDVMNLDDTLVGKQVTIDGSTGKVWVDTDVPVIQSGLDKYSRVMLGLCEDELKKQDYSVSPEEYGFYASFSLNDLWVRVDYTKESIDAALETGGRKLLFYNDHFFGVDESAFDAFMGLGDQKMNAKQVASHLIANIPKEDRFLYTISLPGLEEHIEKLGFTVRDEITSLKELFAFEGEGVKIGADLISFLEQHDVPVDDVKRFVKGSFSVIQEPVKMEPVFCELFNGS